MVTKQQRDDALIRLMNPISEALAGDPLAGTRANDFSILATYAEEQDRAEDELVKALGDVTENHIQMMSKLGLSYRELAALWINKLRGELAEAKEREGKAHNRERQIFQAAWDGGEDFGRDMARCPSNAEAEHRRMLTAELLVRLGMEKA